MNNIVSHVYANGYDNNTRFFNGEGITINGVKFTDFSYSRNACHGLSVSVSNISTPTQLKRALTTASTTDPSSLDKPGNAVIKRY